jgi:acetyltransferase-like isoleucine patch superfamily enzyme
MSRIYQGLNRIGLQLPSAYKEISIVSAIKRAGLYWYRDFLHNMARFCILFGPFTSRHVRPQLYRMMGARVGKNVIIGRDVFIDPAHTEMVTIEDGAMVTARTMLIAHKRNLSQYHKGMWIGDCEHTIAPVHIGKGAHVGVGSIVLPGVRVGEGAVIGAGAVVTKDVPPYALAVGVPAKVVGTIPD